MVFGIYKFFKEIVQEGLAEARAETAAEKADLQAKAQLLAEKYTLLSAEEIFLTSLSAPYREVFISDLSESAEQKRPAYWLSAMEVPEEKKSEIAKYLERDFGVSDQNTLRHQTAFVRTLAFLSVLKEEQLNENDAERIMLLIEEDGENAPTETLEHEADQLAIAVSALALTSIDQEDTSRIVLWLSRLAYIYTVGVGLGYIEKTSAIAQLRPLAQLASPIIKSWEHFGQLFVEGEKQDGTNNLLGRKLLARQVNRLLEETTSPWLKYPWAHGMHKGNAN
jgi:hypothetical protein